MSGNICLKCNVNWEILPYEQYCGYCGCKVFGFSVEWAAEPLFYIGTETDIRELTILVENTGATSIVFQAIQMLPGEALELDSPNEPFEVKPGQLHTVEVRVDPEKLTTTQPEEVTVRVQDALPNLESEKSLTLQVLPPLDFKLTPDLVALRYPKSRKTETVDFQIESQHNQFSIEAIEFSQKWIKDPKFLETPRRIRLWINCAELEVGLNLETLRFKLHGPSQPIEQQIQIQAEVVPEPPKLFVPEVNLEVSQDRKKNYPLKFENKGEVPLTIQNIELNDSSSLVQLPDLDFPIIIEGGGHWDVNVSFSALDIHPATYPIPLTIHSDCVTAPVYQYALNVTVNPREEYPHYLAIDFGTTNSCCAYIDEKYAYKLLSLDSVATPPEIIPSLIIYRSQPKNGETYHVGYDAETDRTSSDDGPYFIASAKRWLGYQWHRQFPNDQQLQPTDVVSDILKHIISQAEDYLEEQELPSKITKCVFTHPTMFTRQQQDDLRQAFEKIGITELIAIDEASAASVGTIFEKYETLQEDYRLLVYDFGGGTIDIVLSQVTNDGSDITIEPLARGGNPRYGGDDVTHAIVEFILKEYRQQIEQTHLGITFDIPYFGPGQILQPSGNDNIDKAARINAALLYNRAEDMKKELSTKPETEFFYSLEVVIGDDVQKVKELIENIPIVKLSEEHLQRFIEPALNETFAAIDAMIADNDARLPDAVVLAGQSSKMGLVREMMEAHFQEKYGTNIEICLGEHPKACVVMGAVQYSLTLSLSDEEGSGVQIINLSNKTHSRLGIVRRVGPKPVFGEIIPKGKVIPDESVNVTNFPLGSRTPYIDVHEHFGLDNDLENASRIAGYTLKLPRSVSPQALKEAQLKMAVIANGAIELSAIVDGEEYKSIVEKQEPEFVNDIYQTGSVTARDV